MKFYPKQNRLIEFTMPYMSATQYSSRVKSELQLYLQQYKLNQFWERRVPAIWHCTGKQEDTASEPKITNL